MSYRTAAAAVLTSRWLRLAVAMAVLVVLLRRVGAGPFLDGLTLVDGWSLAWASVIGLVTTVCCAWRWHLVSRGLGVTVPVRGAVAAYYRSQFLNLTLPGGVAGDVHRAVRHGRDVGDVGRSARAVAWERTAGQLVQVALTVALLLVLPSPVHDAVPRIALGLVVGALVLVLVGRALPASGASRWSRTLGGAVSDVRHGLLAQRAWPGIVLASVLVVAGHTTTFLVAAHAAGVTRSPGELLPLALLVLAAMALPLSIGGWGPREGVAAWAFAVAGLGASLGVTTAVVYGVLVLVACLPGAVVLLVEARRRAVDPVVDVTTPASVTTGGASHG
jgi:uncharacterized membrane protein YbhN (UPF0104 family)